MSNPLPGPYFVCEEKGWFLISANTTDGPKAVATVFGATQAQAAAHARLFSSAPAMKRLLELMLNTREYLPKGAVRLEAEALLAEIRA